MNKQALAAAVALALTYPGAWAQPRPGVNTPALATIALGADGNPVTVCPGASMPYTIKRTGIGPATTGYVRVSYGDAKLGSDKPLTLEPNASYDGTITLPASESPQRQLTINYFRGESCRTIANKKVCKIDGIAMLRWPVVLGGPTMYCYR